MKHYIYPQDLPQKYSKWEYRKVFFILFTEQDCAMCWYCGEQATAGVRHGVVTIMRATHASAFIREQELLFLLVGLCWVREVTIHSGLSFILRFCNNRQTQFSTLTEAMTSVAVWCLESRLQTQIRNLFKLVSTARAHLLTW